jgi:hypothetical protein
MTTKEMSDIVKANVDKTVRVTYSNGEADLALVLTVDDEGFVYDLASVPPEERKTSYWTPSRRSKESKVSVRTSSNVIHVPWRCR